MKYFTVIFIGITSCSWGQREIGGDWSDAINLTIGNFWVYDMSIVQLPHNVRRTQPVDSVFIRKDSLLNGTQYFQLENLFGLSEWKKDSAGYLVNISGQLEFSTHFDKDTLWQNDDIIVFGGSELEDVKVPAGNFVSAVVVAIGKTPAGMEIPKNSPVFFTEEFVITNKRWYVRGIGLVKSIDYYGTTTTFERSLIRYNVR